MINQKNIVISLHGIRTRGTWQKEISGLLSSNDFIYESPDYNYLDVISFYFNALFKSKIRWFYKKYTEIINKYPNYLTQDILNRKNPSIIAHSFGTFIVGYSMLMNEDIKFETVIFCGSILPENFPWEKLFLRNQVVQVRHEYGMKDFWTKSCGKIIPNTGFSGSKGFQFDDRNFFQKAYEQYGHGDFFNENHIKENWLPLLKSSPHKIIIQHGRELNNIEEFEAIAKQTQKIDDQVYGHISEYKNVEPSLDLAKRWISIQPEIYTFCINQTEQKYIGYINAVMVKKECFEKILKEGIHDNKISEEQISSLSEGDSVCMIALSIAIDPEFRKLGEGFMSTPASRLIAGLFDKIEFLAIYKRIKVISFTAVGWTEDGKRICQDILGMKAINEDDYGHPIYSLELDRNKLGNKSKRYRQLMRVIYLYERLNL